MIYLINMPFGSITCPNLPLSIFKSQLARADIESRVLDLNFLFARLIGYSAYQKIARFKEGFDQVGEWIFAPYVWDRPDSEADKQFHRECAAELERTTQIGDPWAWLEMIRRQAVAKYLEMCMQRIEGMGEPTIVGFTSSFFQTLPGLALGRMLKERYPEVKLVYGGANFHGEMGEELIKGVPWIDAVSTGEADHVLIELFTALAEGTDPAGLSGIHYRDAAGEIHHGTPFTPVSQEMFADLPDPDFSDFFDNAVLDGWSEDARWRERLHLFFETSRGCWWGEKAHCTFCGINGVSMAHRVKSGVSVFETIASFVDKYDFSRLQPTDNCMSEDYFANLLPRLSESEFRDKTKLLFEVKPSLGRPQLKMMADAGIVYLHPGIENFSTHLLKLMRKGVSGIQHIYFLKLCRESALIALWNYLVRVPGEVQEDYDEIADLIPSIVHLQPPLRGRVSMIECVRFSPYFFEKGFATNIRPKPWYELLFPEDRFDLSRVAYFFDADWNDTLDPGAYEELSGAIGRWCDLWKSPEALPDLRMEKLDDGSMIIRDTRDPDNHRELELDPIAAWLYELTADPSTFNRIMVCVKKSDHALTPEDVQSQLDRFERERLVMHERHRYLGLAVPESAPRPAIDQRWARV